MPDEKPLVVVVCGYGCHLNTPLGRVYLPRLVSFLEDHSLEEGRIREVIFCGGQTQRKSAGDIAEAEVMRDYVRKVANLWRTLPWNLEANSMTTFENISYTSARLARFADAYIQKPRVVIFCEAHRAPNVIQLARHFMIKKYGVVESIDDITVETASWERADPFKQVFNMVYNKLAITFPWLKLAELEHWRRVRRSHRI